MLSFVGGIGMQGRGHAYAGCAVQAVRAECLAQLGDEIADDVNVDYDIASPRVDEMSWACRARTAPHRRMK